MSKDDSFESERPRSRSEIAAVFRSVADQLDAGGPVTVGDDQSATVNPPKHPVFEIEIEREVDDDGEEVSLELELEWTERTDESASNASTETNNEPIVDDTLGAADIETETTAIESLGRFEVFHDRAEEWRWRLVHRNGNIIATSGEGYTTKQNALKGMRSVMRNAPDAEVVSE